MTPSPPSRPPSTGRRTTTSRCAGRADALAAAGRRRGGGRRPRPAGRRPRARGPPGRRLRRGATGARAGRGPRAPPAARPTWPPAWRPWRPTTRPPRRPSSVPWRSSNRCPSVGGRARAWRATSPGRRRRTRCELTLAVEEALETGDLDEARRRALAAAAGHRAVGQFNAAMDACYQALAIEPSDPDVHLLLAELYLDRGWRGPAADKLVLLGRLSRLTGDERHPDAAVRARHRPSARRPEVRRPLRLTARTPERARPIAGSPGRPGRDATLGDDAASPVDPRSDRPDVHRRYRDHCAPHLLAVQV